MDLNSIHSKNEDALRRVAEFRDGIPEGEHGVVNKRFHFFKNHYPYFGFIEVNPEDVKSIMFCGNDDLIALMYFWFGPHAFEPMSIRLWLDRVPKASTIVDIGAFSGIYALSAATLNPQAKVFAFEPVRRTYGRLLLNIQANDLTRRITPVNLGIADCAGFATINQFRGENILGNGASIMDKSIPATDVEERIRLISLDAFVEEKQIAPNLIKMDVEGAEVLALNGMTEVLSRHRPTLIVEVTPATAPQVRQILDSHGYTVSIIDERAMTTLPYSVTIAATVNLLAEP